MLTEMTMFGLLFGFQLFGPSLGAYAFFAAILPPGQPFGLTAATIVMNMGAA